MVKVNEEALKARARSLQDRGLNGFAFVLVTLLPEDTPVEAHVEAHFHNGHELASIADETTSPHEVFPITGGQRIPAGAANGEVQVLSISEDPEKDQVLHLTVAPIGDYSTYTLGIDHPDFDPLFSKIDFKFRPGCFSIECDPEWESAPAPRDNPVIDYLAKDYDSFKHTLIAAMMQRVPGWQTSSEADLDMVLIELFSAAADELSDYQDRVMNEAYLGTARKRVSVARHARLMDYHIHQGNQAGTWLALRVKSKQEIDRDLESDEDLKIDQDLIVGTGGDRNDADAVIFQSRCRKKELPHEFDPPVVDPLLNNLGLYTWSGTVTTLAAGSTSADLQLLEPDSDGNLVPITDRDSADRIRWLIVDGKIQYLLVQEWLNPATGRAAGRNPQKRQMLKLLPGEQETQVLHDPVQEEDVHFVRVHWEVQDALKADYCFQVDCKDGIKKDISLFHGNLIQVFHGQPIETVFKESGVDKLFLFDIPLLPDPDSDEDAFLIALRERLEEAHIRLSADVSVMDSAAANQWLIMDETANSAYRVEADGDQFKVYLWYLEPYIDYTRTEKWGAVCKLPEGPLAYHETPLGGDIPPKSTLEVRVVGRSRADPWDEVISLVHSDDSAESGDHFVIETDEYGQSLLRFGNGANGRELPENAVVRCTYQVGFGLDGNVGADTLTAFDESVFDIIKECWNPFDVTNGRAPEPVEEIIRNAPEAYRSRQLRAITLNDYVNRAEELEDVAKAAAHYAWTGSWRTVQVTIDPVGATELSPEQRYNINRNLEAVRLIGEDLEIRGPTFVPLDITISLCIHPDYWVEDIRSCLKKELSEGYTPDGRRGFFHPDRWTFGQQLRASELIGRVQRVEGVDHVKQVRMKRWNSAASATNEITDVDFNEIIRVRNNPDFSEEGYIELDIRGGRQ